MNPKVSIILLNYNNYYNIKKCIQSLLGATYNPLEIIVVDNGSKREEIEEIKRDFGDKITLIENEENLGFAEGNNVALRRVTSRYSLVLNNDTIVTPNFLEPLVEVLEKDETIAAVQPKLLDSERKNYFEYAGAAGGFMDVFGYPFTRGRIFNFMEEDGGQYDDPVDVVWCSGAAMLVRNSVLRKTGLFDPMFFMYAEEADLCWRMHFCNYRMVFVPSSVIYHKGGLRGKIKFHKIYLTHRNGLYMLFKNYSWGELAKYLPIRIFFDSVTFFYYLFSCPTKFVWLALPKAYLDFLITLPRVWQKRKKSQVLRKKCKRKYPLYKKSILAQYFIFRRKKYSDLEI